MRKKYFELLYQYMRSNPNVWAVTADLGYGGFDRIQRDFPDRFINVGAAEQAMMGVAVGLAMEGKIVFTYTISPFYLRAYETIKLYLNHEQIPVIMVGSGLNDDYKKDGFTHAAWDMPKIIESFDNIIYFQPINEKELIYNFNIIIESKKPSYLGLKRE